jgi:alkylhydroperoxidase family enzyme
MAWIEQVDGDQWAGELAVLRPQVADPQTREVDNIMRIHSLDSGSMRAHLAMYVQAMRGTTSLPKSEREMIAIVVSKANECEY